MYLFCRDNVASPHTCHKPRARLRCSEIQIGQPASVSIARLNPHPSNTTTTENPTDMEFTMTWNRVTRKMGREKDWLARVLLVRSVLTRVQYSTCAACFGGFSSQVGRTCETNFREKIIIGQRSVGTTSSFQRKTELTVLIVIHALFIDGNCSEQNFCL